MFKSFDIRTIFLFNVQYNLLYLLSTSSKLLFDELNLILGCMLSFSFPYKLSIGQLKTHPKISVSLLATVQCPRL